MYFPRDDLDHNADIGVITICAREAQIEEDCVGPDLSHPDFDLVEDEDGCFTIIVPGSSVKPHLDTVLSAVN